MKFTVCPLTRWLLSPALPFSSGTWPSLPSHANVIHGPTLPTSQPRWTPEIQQSDDKAAVSGRPASWAAHWLRLAAWNAYRCQPAVIVNKAMRGKMVVFFFFLLFLTKWLIPPPAVSCRRLRKEQEMLEVQVQDTFTSLEANSRGCHTLLLSLIGPGKKCLNQRGCLRAADLRPRGKTDNHTASKWQWQS